MASLVASLVFPLAAWLVAKALSVIASVEELFVSGVRLYFLPFRTVLQHVQQLVEKLQPPPPPPPAAVEIDLDAGLRVPEGAVAPPGAAPPTATPLAGFLVATVAAPSVAGSSSAGAAERSSDTSSDDDVVPDLSSCSFSDGKKIVRDSSFRKRDAAKVERAQAIKARSNCLASHLVTPGPVRRSVDHSALSVLRETDASADGKVAPHSVTITPRKVEIAEIAERGPLTESTFDPSLRIPPHAAAAPKPTGGANGDANKACGAAKGAANGAANGANGKIKRRAKGGKAKKQLGNFSVLAKAGVAGPG